MKSLLICEGPVEKKVVDLLLDENKLKVTKEELVGNQIFHARKIKDNSAVLFWLNQCEEPVSVMMIGDTIRKKVVIPKELNNIISENRVFRYCTKPEIEMLLIISENKLKEFEKLKNKIGPKQFAYKYIKYNKQKYQNSPKFYQEYYGKRIDLLISSIKEYKRTHKKHCKEELYLFDLLK